MFYVPGAEFMDTLEVPHGGGDVSHLLFAPRSEDFAACTFIRRRDMSWGRTKYPVLYLLHGAGDSDASWSSRRPGRLHPR